MDNDKRIKVTVINDDELLYRSFPVPDLRGNVPMLHFSDQEGKVGFLKTAFNDRKKEPSVDRASYLSSPEEAKMNQNDGIIAITAQEVREMSIHEQTHNPISDPTPQRPAHAILKTYPSFGQTKSEKRRWKGFQDLLAAAATNRGWLVNPPYD